MCTSWKWHYAHALGMGLGACPGNGTHGLHAVDQQQWYGDAVYPVLGCHPQAVLKPQEDGVAGL